MQVPGERNELRNGLSKDMLPREFRGGESVASDPLWYKRAIIYELHVRSFLDTDGNGSGDFAGLAAKLDYLQQLGVTAVWLLPFCPSPWLDDGYDVCDYGAIHPVYGTMNDFHAFLAECKRRALRVITELVINHTSNQHPWFERARRSPAGSRWRDFYVWSDTPQRYAGTRVIFSDFEESNWTWDPVANAYYWHRFFSHQPDLNFDSPDVRQAVFDVVDFWFELGVDGLRLDAIPYLYEREGTNCENLSETHEFLRQLRRHVDSRFTDRMLLAEANQWPEDAVAYFGSGDECHMAFHFPLMPRLFMATRTEDSFPVINILEQTPPIPDTCQWATFLRNHDELTLEMVREEERDYMYRAYARDPSMRINAGIRRRLAPLLENDRRRIELMHGLLFSMPGTPVLYYGDEIGMGDAVALGDRNGVRTPMQWSAGKNAGFSHAQAEQLYLPVITDSEYHYEFVNVEAQEARPNSLLWWMRRIIAVRKESAALADGRLQFLYPENRRVLAFLRRTESETVLVVANLSRFAQSVRLRLAEFTTYTPVEMFGGVEFPRVGSGLYALSLAPYGFYWFVLRPSPVLGKTLSELGELPASSLDEVLVWENRGLLARMLLPYLRTANQHRPRVVTGTVITDLLPVSRRGALAMVDIQLDGGDPEAQLVPLILSDAAAPREGSAVTIATIHCADGETALLQAGDYPAEMANTLLHLISGEGRLAGLTGELAGAAAGPYAQATLHRGVCLLTEPPEQQERNLSIRFGDLFILKMLLRLEPGRNPDVDISRFLFESAGFMHAAPAAGCLEYRSSRSDPIIVGVLHAFVQHQQSFWQHTMTHLGMYFERALALRRMPPPRVPAHPLDIGSEEPAEAGDLIQTFLEDARLLGKRTGELHLALASSAADPAFAPQPFDAFHLRGEYHRLAGLARESLQLLRSRQRSLPGHAQADVRAVLDAETAILDRFQAIREVTQPGLRIRIHGDFHLKQILETGGDLIFIDFEGDVSRSLDERRIKRSPLQDIAGMLHSFRAAATSAAFEKVPGLVAGYADPDYLAAWARFWYVYAGAAFLNQYRSMLRDSPILPGNPAALRSMLDLYLLSKAIYDLGHELSNRPEWAPVALRAVRELSSEGAVGSTKRSPTT